MFLAWLCKMIKVKLNLPGEFGATGLWTSMCIYAHLCAACHGKLSNRYYIGCRVTNIGSGKRRGWTSVHPCCAIRAGRVRKLNWTNWTEAPAPHTPIWTERAGKRPYQGGELNWKNFSHMILIWICGPKTPCHTPDRYTGTASKTHHIFTQARDGYHSSWYPDLKYFIFPT